MYVTNDDHTRKVYQDFEKLFEENRFFIDTEHDLIKHFLPEFVEKKTFVIPQGTVFYRARINKHEPFTKDEDLKAPRKGEASAGRLNPKGIPYLYVSESIETIVAEVQPWIGAEITIAECKARRDLKVVDFTPSDVELSAPNNYRRVISEEFSKPVRPDSKELSYLPTQFIAEYFRIKGLDGLKYESAVHMGGKNIALFDVEAMDVRLSKKVKVTKIDYSFIEI
jgi:RES domain-containing protein